MTEKYSVPGKMNLILFAGLALIGIFGRVVFSDYPNVETILVVCFLAGILLDSRIAMLVPLIAMVASDILIGNTIFSGSKINQIVMFTYSGFVMVSLISMFGKKRVAKSISAFNLKSVAISAGLGAGFAILYDIWTNMGWWYLLYPHTLENLFSVYVAGIPFMLYHIASGAATFVLIGLPVILFARSRMEASDCNPAPNRASLRDLAARNAVPIAILFTLIAFLFMP